MPKPKTCSICCLAMLSGISFESVIDKVFEKTKPKRLSMSFAEMNNALNKLGLKTNILDRFPAVPAFNMLCQCRSKSRRFWHYIVYDKQRGVFLDPMPSKWPLDDYAITKCIEIIE